MGRFDRTFIEQAFEQRVGVVFPAQPALAARGADFDDSREDFKHGDVERAAAKIEDQQARFFIRIAVAVGQRGRGGFVDDAGDGQSGELRGFGGGLALAFAKIRAGTQVRALRWFLPR